MTVALEAKEKGNAAFTKGDFPTAIVHYTEAIENDQENNTEMLHIFYSNRSACYLSLKKCNEALSDAEKAIETKPQWGKGYSRKGAALFSLNKYKEAVAAYKKGLNIDPSNEVLQNGLRDAEIAMKSVVSLRTFICGDRKATHRSIQFFLRLLMLSSFLMYLYPLASPAYYATLYSRFFKATITNYFIHVFQTHGMIKFNIEYATRLFQDGTSQYLLFALTMLGSIPSLISMSPFMIGAIPHLASYCSGLLQLCSPTLYSNVVTITDPKLAQILQNPRWSLMTTEAKWNLFNDATLSQMAFLDILVGFTLIMELFTPYRNFILVFCYFQLFKLRYLTSSHTKAAVYTMDQYILTLVRHPRAPSLLATIYDKIRGFIARMGQVAQPSDGQPRSSLASRCSVM